MISEQFYRYADEMRLSIELFIIQNDFEGIDLAFFFMGRDFDAYSGLNGNKR
jgi:hypothetical protein